MKSNTELIDAFTAQLSECHVLLKKLNETQAQLDEQKQQVMIEIAKIESRRDLAMISTAIEDERMTKALNTVH